jgi:hypothetical protein
MTYEELCDDERWKTLLRRCDNLPIFKVSACKIEDMWSEMQIILGKVLKPIMTQMIFAII